MKSELPSSARRSSVFRLCMILASLLLASCVSPAGKIVQVAAEQGFERSQLIAGGFRLRVYRNLQAQYSQHRQQTNNSGRLHVYLEGDGSPWRYRTFIMADPTSRQPLMLKLMQQDAQPSVYLGRPCYNGASRDAGCDQSLWTSGRYSQVVVDSMAAGLRILARRYGATELWLMGHSGGGTLAMLLAREVDLVTRIVTVAGNLDTDAWIAHHNYTPLYGSLNPAKLPPLRKDVWQWHLLGGRDSVIPAPLVRRYIMRQPTASGIIIEQFSHGCCWQLLWPRVLDALNRDEPGRIPGIQFKFRDDRLEASGSR